MRLLLGLTKLSPLGDVTLTGEPLTSVPEGNTYRPKDETVYM